MRFLGRLLAWLGATLVTAAAGSIVQTQFGLAAIQALGVPVPWQVRLQSTLHDLAGFAPTFALIVAGGFLVAFLVAGLLLRWWPRRPVLLYTLAGASAIGTALLVMDAVLPVTAIGAARSLAGLLALTATGALGGYVYARLAPTPGRAGVA
jgi:hypothetical protein